MTDIEFVDGLSAKAPHENAPDFVKCKLAIKRKDLGSWLHKKEDEWINLDVKVSKAGKWYVAVDTFKPEPQGEQAAPASVDPDFDDDIGF